MGGIAVGEDLLHPFERAAQQLLGAAEGAPDGHRHFAHRVAGHETKGEDLPVALAEPRQRLADVELFEDWRRHRQIDACDVDQLRAAAAAPVRAAGVTQRADDIRARREDSHGTAVGEIGVVHEIGCIVLRHTELLGRDVEEQ
jgi:hypothetical protein